MSEAQKLVACPLCGVDEGYRLSEGSTYRWWSVTCAGCGQEVSEARATYPAEQTPRTLAADEAWNRAGTHAQSLRDRIAAIEAQQAQGVPPDRVFQLADAHAEESYENGDRRFDRGGLIQFAKELLAAAPQAEPQPEPTTWSRYVAGMIACYLQWPDDDERTEAVAGIIERRRWSDRQPELEPMNPDQSASFQWLERLCEPALYLDRLGPLRDYLRTHGIGTKGGGTK